MNDDELGRLYRDAIDTVPGSAANAGQARAIARTRRRTQRVAAAALVAVALATGFAVLPRTFGDAGTVAAPSTAGPTTDPHTASTPGPAVPERQQGSAAPDQAGLLVGYGLVLDEGSGPRLCLGAVPSVSPPQCPGESGPRGGGVPLRDWKWPGEGVRRASGTISGTFTVIGRYDGTTFTVEKVDQNQYRQQPEDGMPDLSSRCPTPAGGWRAPDPDRATEDDKERAQAAARKLPSYALSWTDDLGDSRRDPQKIVLNVAVTQDLDGAEQTLREVWGGSLCVSQAKHTRAELTSIQIKLSKLPGVLSAGQGMNRVELDVVYDDGTLQRELDQTYGEGTVHVRSELRPYTG